MTFPALNRAQSREVDRIAIEKLGFSSLVLMENAGRGCVDILERLGINNGGHVSIICGKGNNAGDGFVIARHLRIREYPCRVLLLQSASEFQGDATVNFAILQKCEVPIVDLSIVPQDLLETKLEENSADADWIVDAMLGTGAQGAPRSPFDAAIRWINARRNQSPARVLAVDIPSGLDCDTGQPFAEAVRADHTCTFATTKTGFSRAEAKPYVGTVHVCDIGVPIKTSMFNH